jgi:arylsulfotransferase ASST
MADDPATSNVVAPAPRQYTRALELALDWSSMTAAKVWEYRHQVGASGGAPAYKYSGAVGSAQRLENGNTLVMFGADTNPTTLLTRNPQTFTVVEADASPEAGALAVPGDRAVTWGSIFFEACSSDDVVGPRCGWHTRTLS